MVYGYKGTKIIGDGNDPYKNITGNLANTLVTLLNVILTKENAEVIEELVTGLLEGVELPEGLDGVIEKVLGDEKGLVNLIGTVVLVLTGDYELKPIDFVFKFLGKVDYNVDNADEAIKNLDELLNIAIPKVLPLIAGENPTGILKTISDAANNVPYNKTVIANIIDTILNDMVFKQDMMDTITNLVVGTVGGILTESLCGTIDSLLGIDLSPAGFAAAAKARGNDAISTYVGDAKTWADVQAAHKTADGKYESIFTGVDTKKEFLDGIYAILAAVEPVLGFLLTGKNLEISAKAEGSDEAIGITILGNNGYENAIKYLIKGLGIVTTEEAWTTLEEGDNAVDALSYIVDYIFDLVDMIGEKPFDTILKLVANLSYLIANDGVEVILTNLLSPVLSLLDALEGTISRAELDALIETFVKVDLLGKPLNITNILTIAGDGGAALITLLNGILPKYEYYHMEGGKIVEYTKAQADADSANKYVEVKKEDESVVYYRVIKVINILPETFFVDLAKAAIDVTDPANPEIGDTVASWTVNTGDVLVYILKTVLTQDVMNIFKGSPDATGTLADILDALVNKDKQVLDLLIALLAPYDVEYKAYTQPVNDKIHVVLDDEGNVDYELRESLESAVGGLDALIPTVLGLLVKDSNGQAVSSLKALVNDLLAGADLGSVLMNLLVPLLANLNIDNILVYVNDLTNLEINLAPEAFAKNNFNSKLAEFIGNAETWADVRDARFDKVVAEDGTVSYTMKKFDFAITDLYSLINFVADLTAPLDQILGLILSGGDIKALEKVNICGGNGYNYSIIPLLELLGITADSQADYNAKVADNYGSALYPILKQIADKLYGTNGVLNNPVSWLADILANLCYVLANDDVTTIIDNLIAPVNTLIALVDEIIPIAIDIDLARMGRDDFVITSIGGVGHAGLDAGIHVKVTGDAVASLLVGLLGGIEISGKPLLKDKNSFKLEWAKLAAMAAEVDENGKMEFAETNLNPSLDKYSGGKYKTVVGNAADTFMTIITMVLGAIDLEGLLGGIAIPEEFKGIVDQIIADPTSIVTLLGGLFGDPVYQPVQNATIYNEGINYNNFLTFSDQNADIIARDLDALIMKILNEAGIGSLRQLLSTYISANTLNSLLDTIFGLLGGGSVAGILNTVKGLELTVKTSMSDEGKPLVIDLTPAGFYKAISSLSGNADYSYLNGFKAKLKAAIELKGEDATWTDVGSMAGVNWKFADGDVDGFVRAIAGVLTPLNGILELLLMGEGKILSILGLINISGGNGYDFGIIPLIEALGLTANTEMQYIQAVRADKTQLLGYILGKVAELVNKLLDKPVDTLLTILPNLAYYISNHGLLLTVKNLLAPIYPVLGTVLPIFGIDVEQYLKLEEVLSKITIPVNLGSLGKYNLTLPDIDWTELAEIGAADIVEASTARSYPNDSVKSEKPWANSFKQNLRPDQYAAYANTEVNGIKNVDNASLYKTTQTTVVADKGDTLIYVLQFVFNVFSTEANREALVQWICDFFELKSGAEETVRYAVNELFRQAQAANSTDLIVSALLAGLGMTITVDAALTGNVRQIQIIFKDLFGTLANSGELTYGSIARAMQKLTGVWDDTIGDEEDYEDAVEDAEETLNWFQKIIKKIKDFFAKIFSIFK